ncbi:hypothetical protein ACFY2K_26090 [Kitasatospora sp. NPDC001309]|uniref:hypothetical protein n=1 Tax=Kitasatospora sp. NPDC001309 TaxID=3364013 RepID=UPI003694465A
MADLTTGMNSKTTHKTDVKATADQNNQAAQKSDLLQRFYEKTHPVSEDAGTGGEAPQG